MTKRIVITVETHRAVYDQEYAPREKFNPFLDKDGNICLSEEEITKIQNPEFFFLKQQEAKEPEEIEKNLTKEEWIQYDLLETQKRLELLNEKKEVIEIKK